FSSAIVMGAAGILLTFLPQEAAALIGWPNGSIVVLQTFGAIYFGFAMTNWMLKGTLIGGIYNRPVAVGNFSHFFIAAMALLKFSPKSIALIIVTFLYCILATAFGYILFTHPVK